MSQQFDIEAGLDPTPLTELSASQLLQMVNQSKPLSNIGGIIYGTTAPTQTEVEVDNPRWIRYLFLHYGGSGAPVPKIWNQTTKVWDSIVVGANSINNAQLNGFVVSVLSNLTRTAADEIDASKAKFILRLDANGQRVEIVSINQILNEEKVEASQMDVNSVNDNYFVVKRAGSPLWGPFNPETDITDGALPVDKLASGGNNMLLATNGSGVISFMTIANAILAGYIRLDKLGVSYDDTAPIDGQVVTNRAAGKKWETPKIANEFVFTLTNTEQVLGTLTGGRLPAAGAFAVWQVAHNLGAIPKYVQVRLVCITNDVNFSAGDELDITSVHRNNAGVEVRGAHMLKVTSSVVRLQINNGATSLQTWDNNGGATLLHTFTPGNWAIKVIAHN